MNQEAYNAVVHLLHTRATEIADAKRPAYTAGSEDVLANFKNTAARLGLQPLQVWGVYFDKHITAILSYAKDATIPQGEPLMGRFADALNYLDLGWALANEMKNATITIPVQKNQ